ncbi:MAG TPA: energy transducer TonB [Pyrinomonadaceae bacterium]|nr:energy transducer TonB [Pyrinomonadaceae bacterium]
MKRELGIALIAFVVIAGIGTSLSFAQQQAPPEKRWVEMERMSQGGPPPNGDQVYFQQQLPSPPGPDGAGVAGMAGDFVFFNTEMGFVGKTVKGAPYSAQTVTETVQVLSDGNRIVNKSTSGIYRDSDGRIRREQTLKAIGPFANGGEGMQTIFISDPVAGTSYSLDPRTRLARKLPPTRFTVALKTPGSNDEQTAEIQLLAEDKVALERAEAERPKITAMTQQDTLVWGWGNHAPKNESLGKQNIEGVEAEGSRSTVTIPAGEIGNERPIEIVNERWYSPELQVVVMTRHTDPRFGETTYRLTNIDRSEPARSLFEVPADYTLKTGPSMGSGVGGGGGISAGAGGVSGSGGSFSYSRLESGIRGGVLNGKAISLPVPAYPAIAKAANASGTVTVEVTIDEDGNVISAKAVGGHPLLQAASVAAARNAKFSPTKLSGQPVKVTGVLTYTFAAEGGDQRENQ